MTLSRRLMLIAVGVLVAALALLVGLPGVFGGAFPAALAPGATPRAAATSTSVATPPVALPAATATPLPPTPGVSPSAVRAAATSTSVATPAVVPPREAPRHDPSA